MYGLEAYFTDANIRSHLPLYACMRAVLKSGLLCPRQPPLRGSVYRMCAGS